jgi:tetratricopeptide (TPR) repeat protein
MRFQSIVGAAALAFIFAGSASAAVTVLGDASAQACSQAAFHDKADQDAMNACTTALSSDFLDRRDRAGTFINRGVMWMIRKDFQSARGDFERAIAIDPDLGEAWVDRGAVNIIDRRYQDGISDIDKGLQLGTEEPAKAYYNRAVAYEGIDDEKSAYLDFEQALTLEPGWDLPKQELLRFTVIRKAVQ